MASTPPRIPPLDLPALTPLDVSELISYGSYEAALLTRADISGLDLSGAQFLDCELSIVDAAAPDFSNARFASTHLDRWNAPEVAARRSAWRNVEVTQSRLGAIELFDATIRSVRFVGCKIGWLNLRAARLQDVEFVDCVFDELDLGQAEVERVRFTECEIRSLRVDQTKLSNLDLRGAHLAGISGLDNLRGATITMQQAVELIEVFADHLGIQVED